MGFAAKLKEKKNDGFRGYFFIFSFFLLSLSIRIPYNKPLEIIYNLALFTSTQNPKNFQDSP